MLPCKYRAFTSRERGTGPLVVGRFLVAMGILFFQFRENRLEFSEQGVELGIHRRVVLVINADDFLHRMGKFY
jgi:hypothetical protein